jgi:hypothetical protein
MILNIFSFESRTRASRKNKSFKFHIITLLDGNGPVGLGNIEPGLRT